MAFAFYNYDYKRLYSCKQVRTNLLLSHLLVTVIAHFTAAGYNDGVTLYLILLEVKSVLTKEELPACPVATTVALIGSKWKLLIMRNLQMRTWRFNELKKDLDGIS